MNNYFSLITKRGFDKLTKAHSNGKTLDLTTFAVGDSLGNDDAVPVETQTKLINEVHRSDISRMFQDKTNKHVLIVELLIPANICGFVIREVGIFDSDGELFAIGKTPTTIKPNLNEGVAREEILQVALVHQNSSSIELKIDSSTVIASMKYVDEQFINHINDVNPHIQYALKSDLYFNKLVLRVGEKQQYKSIQSAWNDIKGKIINANIEIKIDDGTYLIDSNIQLIRAPTGGKISITGNNECPSKVILKSNPQYLGNILNINNVPQLTLSGLTIEGNSNNNAVGINIVSSSINIIDGTVIIKNLKCGINITKNSELSATKTEIINCCVGAQASNASTLNLESSIINGPGKSFKTDNILSTGISCLHSSVIYADNASISNVNMGLLCSKHSIIEANNITVNQCQKGVFSTKHGFITTNQSKVSNCEHAFLASHSSSLEAITSQVCNALYGYFASDFSFILAQKNNSSNCKIPYTPTPGVISNYGSMIRIK